MTVLDLLANEIGRFVHEWSPIRLCCAHTALHVQVSRVIRCAFGVWYREPDYSPLAHQFVTVCRLVCGSAGVARRHASRTSSLVTALVTR